MTIVDVNEIIPIILEAGRKILSIYNQKNVLVTLKKDDSPLTEADLASHHYICKALQQLYPLIPIISEESSLSYSYAARRQFEYFFLIDPLDGTKEFIHRNGEFTINIALIHKNCPIMGVIYAPVFNMLYYAEEKKGAFKKIDDAFFKLPLQMKKENHCIRVLQSRSHHCQKNEIFLKEMEEQGKAVQMISVGSALKFGLIAEGKADIYARFSPSMEWDTAAGHLLINEIGKTLMIEGINQPLLYNKENLLNPGFIVS